MCVFTCVCMFLYVCVCDVCRDPRSRSRRYRKVSQLYWKQSIFCRVSMFIIIVRIQTFSNYSSTKNFNSSIHTNHELCSSLCYDLNLYSFSQLMYIGVFSLPHSQAIWKKNWNGSGNTVIDGFHACMECGFTSGGQESGLCLAQLCTKYKLVMSERFAVQLPLDRAFALWKLVT